MNETSGSITVVEENLPQENVYLPLPPPITLSSPQPSLTFNLSYPEIMEKEILRLEKTITDQNKLILDIQKENSDECRWNEEEDFEDFRVEENRQEIKDTWESVSYEEIKQTIMPPPMTGKNLNTYLPAHSSRHYKKIFNYLKLRYMFFLGYIIGFCVGVLIMLWLN